MFMFKVGNAVPVQIRAKRPGVFAMRLRDDPSQHSNDRPGRLAKSLASPASMKSLTVPWHEAVDRPRLLRGDSFCSKGIPTRNKGHRY